MRESQNLFWGGTTKKQVAFTIIWTIGIICWGYFLLQFTGILHEADQAYSEAMKLQKNANEGPVQADPHEQSQPESKPVSLETGRDGINPVPSGQIEKLIYAYFKEEPKTAIAIFTVESQLNPDAQGFNCHYEKAGKTVSEACRKGDEDKAWSTDCGLTQINVVGKVCPQELFDPDHNLEVARQKYEARNWQPWSAWKSGKYLAFL